MTNESSNELSIATLGGGCFWCLEAVFERLRGVVSVRSGYCGGQVADPDYAAVCRGDTGHAEVVRIEFDEATITYRDLLEVFFAIHDPTTLNRQGNDVGTQYRSVIFTHSDRQQAVAREVIAALAASKKYASAIVTEVLPCPKFYPAEGYHQQYFANNPHQPYCMAVVGPKVRKFVDTFASKLK